VPAPISRVPIIAPAIIAKKTVFGPILIIRSAGISRFGDASQGRHQHNAASDGDFQAKERRKFR
jgi:hypothetical protein